MNKINRAISISMSLVFVLLLSVGSVFAASSGDITVHVPNLGRWSSRTHGVIKDDDEYGTINTKEKTHVLANYAQFYSYALDKRISNGNYHLNWQNYEFGSAHANKTNLHYSGNNKDWNGYRVHVRLKSSLLEPNLGYTKINFTP